MNADFLVYAVHALFWLSFIGTRMVVSRSIDAPATSGEASVATSQVAPYSRLTLVFHMTAFGVMYFGMAACVLPDRVPHYFPGQALLGTSVILLGAWLACWALVYFRSWRFRAKLDKGHTLAIDGPFRYVRHPIYAGLNLLSLGTAIWIPTPLLWASVLLMVIGSDLRARSEETLLAQSFGQAYTEYCQKTSRFLPGIY